MAKMNPIYHLQKWMDTFAGQTFMQYTYSWGAAIVILGTLFKLTHIPGANLMLFIGMGTEVFVFFIAAFERVTEKVPDAPQPQTTVGNVGTPIVVGGFIPNATDETGETGKANDISLNEVSCVSDFSTDHSSPSLSTPTEPCDHEAMVAGAGLSAAAANLAAAGQAAAEAQLALSQLQNGGGTPLNIAAINATDPIAIEEAVKNYAEELTQLTEVLGRVKIQAERMSTDSEEMENLNRTLTGIATVYELQLRNISKQVSTIEQIDEQTKRMAKQIEELNNVYARMIAALTVNMGGNVAPMNN